MTKARPTSSLIWRVAIAIAVATGLSGCLGWRDDSAPPQTTPQPAPAIVRAAPEVEFVPKPPPPASDGRIALKAPRPLPRPFRIAQYAPIDPAWGVAPFGPMQGEVVEPVNVVGLSEDETVGMLGEPDGLSWRPPSRVLRYASNDCVVDIYFYLDVAKDKFQALQLKAPDSIADEASLRACLGKVRDERRTQ